MRRLLLAIALLLAGPFAWAQQLPILFVHGDQESATIWQTQIWRFESNGYDPKLLSAISFTHPKHRDFDHQPQANRSSTEDQLAELGAMVDKVLTESGQTKLVLIASSRGGNSVRNFIKHGGKDKVALAILCGTPNHGVYRLPFRWDVEFNGIGPFLRGLNNPETVDGVRYVTLRSDHNDKFAQPFGQYVGFPHIPTFVGSDGAALKGAENIVLPGLDHKEVAFHRLAFAELYRAVTGAEPQTLDFVEEAAPALSGVVSGWENEAPTNLPLAGATVQAFEVLPASGERKGDAVFSQTTGADGVWGPFTADPHAYYEFVITVDGYPVTHFYKTPFARSSRHVFWRLQPLAKADVAMVTLFRPRGYFGKGRDIIQIDGAAPDDVPGGVPSVDKASKVYPASPARSVTMRFNDENLAVRTFENQRVVAELHN